MAQYVDCPICELANVIPDEYIGRYFRCHQCHCRYYVFVPQLDEICGPIVGRAQRTTRASTDNLLCDDYEDQEQVFCTLRKQKRAIAKLARLLQYSRLLLIVFVVASIVESALLLGLLAAR